MNGNFNAHSSLLQITPKMFSILLNNRLSDHSTAAAGEKDTQTH